MKHFLLLMFVAMSVAWLWIGIPSEAKASFKATVSKHKGIIAALATGAVSLFLLFVFAVKTSPVQLF